MRNFDEKGVKYGQNLKYVQRTRVTSLSFSIDDNRKIMRSFDSNAQQTFTCSKSTMETLEKGVKCVSS